MQNIFDELEIYFKLISKFKGLSIESPYNFITSKNAIRLAELESWDGFNQLNLFISNHTTFSGIKNLFDKSNEILGKSKSLLNNSEGLISHGDLCFSNILIDEKDCKLVFIDPRGGEINNNFRTPYYDLAKLCHSLLGGYDHIINNVAEIQFDQSMQATILFNQNLMEYEKVFSSFVENLGMNYSLVREIEISLFLSMLPLHIDSTKKVNMLALRASELILAAEKIAKVISISKNLDKNLKLAALSSFLVLISSKGWIEYRLGISPSLIIYSLICFLFFFFRKEVHFYVDSKLKSNFCDLDFLIIFFLISHSIINQNLSIHALSFGILFIFFSSIISSDKKQNIDILLASLLIAAVISLGGVLIGLVEGLIGTSTKFIAIEPENYPNPMIGVFQ